jgi:hypothetical protein
MSKNAAATVAHVLERKDFMQRMNERALKSAAYAWATAAIAVIVSSLLTWQLLTRERVYFGVSEQGQILPMIPLSSPTISQAALLQYAVDSTRKCFTVDFVNQASQRMECSSAFTLMGWDAFNQEMSKSGGFIQTVINDRLVTSAVALEAPVIREQGLRNGIAFWVVQFPFLITYASGAQKTSQSLMASITVTRRPITEHPLGIGISQAITTSFQR